MILLIDNYDSFSYNLYQLIGEIQPDIRVIRNDELTIEQIRELAPDHIILSPGHLGKDHPNLGRLLGTSGNLRCLWRNRYLCKGTNARKAVGRYL